MPRLTWFVAAATAITAGAWAASPFDGTYHGTYTWAGNGNATRCGGGDMRVTVTDGKFAYTPLGGAGSATATVGPDGSFSAQAGDRYLSGKIQGDQLTGTTTGGRCNFIWALKK